MQSDERVVAALAALRPRVAAFRFAVSGALERASSTLASESGSGQARGARLLVPSPDETLDRAPESALLAVGAVNFR